MSISEETKVHGVFSHQGLAGSWLQINAMKRVVCVLAEVVVHVVRDCSVQVAIQPFYPLLPVLLAHDNVDTERLVVLHDKVAHGEKVKELLEAEPHLRGFVYVPDIVVDGIELVYLEACGVLGDLLRAFIGLEVVKGRDEAFAGVANRCSREVPVVQVSFGCVLKKLLHCPVGARIDTSFFDFLHEQRRSLYCTATSLGYVDVRNLVVAGYLLVLVTPVQRELLIC